MKIINFIGPSSVKAFTHNGAGFFVMPEVNTWIVNAFISSE